MAPQVICAIVFGIIVIILAIVGILQQYFYHQAKGLDLPNIYKGPAC
jgi:hypothetical protein